ncbi:protein SRG1-like [Prunus yedoensis var. nudiflora]|uniref:Protein SRG1-like n=1 Tax=Prunus yedoensis var. nudiflora TaxID=2094558 RepID=A0A314YS13_PRUYE|nr:protein SRG1-like [Prunus yedoensis var. nudiflora]
MSSTPDMAFAPNVQEIVRSDPSQIPENFLIIRNEEKGKSNNTTDTCHLSLEIPIVDLSLLSRGHKEELNKTN